MFGRILRLVSFVFVGMIIFFGSSNFALAQTPLNDKSAGSPAVNTVTSYTVKTTYKSFIGSYLTDSRGMTLYYTTSDACMLSNITDELLVVWPVFYTPSIVVPPSLNPADFSSFTRDLNIPQSTYRGWPLYFSTMDKAAGDTVAHGVSGVWLAVTLNQALAPGSPVQIMSRSLTAGVAGRAYSCNLSAAGGAGPYAWSATGVPAGLTLSPNGTLSGTPTAAGNYTLNITVTDSSVPSGNYSGSVTLNIYLAGDANGDGLINMGDVTQVERVILSIDPVTAGCEATGDGIVNMGDVTRIERIILGLP